MSAPRPSHPADVTTRAPRTTVQVVSLVAGIVFGLVGLAGFVPGITTNLDGLGFAMSGSTALLLGLFQVSVLHNIVHLLYGVVGVIAARTAVASRGYLIIGGIVYLVLFVYGLVVPMDSMANFVPLNGADNWLHLVLGVVMVLLGFVLPGGPRRAGGASEGAR